MYKAVTSDKTTSLLGFLENAGKIAVITHTRPDGDAVGSTVGLVSALREWYPGKEVSLLYADPVPGFLDFLTAGEEAVPAWEDEERASSIISGADLLVCLDVSSLARTGRLEGAARTSGAPRILVDHHLSPAEDEFALVFSETTVSSASELLYGILLSMPQSGGKASGLPAKTACAVMTGMTTDTNNFANSVFPSTLSMASELLGAGVDRDFIIGKLYNECRENRVRAMAHILSERLVTRPGEGYAYIVLDRETLERFDIHEGELEGLVNIPLTIKQIRLSIYLREDDGFYRVSIRSKRGVSANRLARDCYNGGGHEQAAGGKLFFPGDIATKELAPEYIERTARLVQGLTTD